MVQKKPGNIQNKLSGITIKRLGNMKIVHIN